MTGDAPGDGVAPDGSPVALYRRLRAGDDGTVVGGSVPAGATVLDLGCGAGRLAHPLAARGHAVTAVDASPEMLACVRGCQTVRGDIATLALKRRFGAVLLAGNLVNDDRGPAYLRTSGRHVAADGVVLLQRLDPVWAATAQPFTSERDGVRTTLSDVVADGRVLAGRLTYEFDGVRCEHRFRSRVLDDDALSAVAADAGLAVASFLDDRRTWVRAVPR